MLSNYIFTNQFVIFKLNSSKAVDEAFERTHVTNDFFQKNREKYTHKGENTKDYMGK